ncbi:hypothetical protein ANANG_G00189050 [Anguilla anguilla]|uniref:Uncharacterized protein n=1 Tax=Anguilla anguilla TaxID=7936 RepID=A0A9D3M482_ANGAN|nr:hypothetical protein ANANG_G00189050 [Anguilla anguilla]
MTYVIIWFPQAARRKRNGEKRPNRPKAAGRRRLQYSARPKPRPRTEQAMAAQVFVPPARKKIQLPVTPFWKGAPYPRPLVKYTSALPLRWARLRRKAPLPPRAGRAARQARGRASPSPARLRSSQSGTSQKPAAAQDRGRGRAGPSDPARPRPLQTRTQAPPNTPAERAPPEGERRGRGGCEQGLQSGQVPSALQPQLRLQLPLPAPVPLPLQRRRTRYLSRRYLQQMEWYRALRKEKKLRDARRRLDELCSMVSPTPPYTPGPAWVKHRGGKFRFRK